MIHKVTCPIEKLKELILNEYPDYYSQSPKRKQEIIFEFTPEINIVYKYMSENQGSD